MTSQATLFPLSPTNLPLICYLTGDQSTLSPLDLAWQNRLAQLSGGLSPASLLLALMDWALHLQHAPGKQAELIRLIETQLQEWPEFLQVAWQHAMQNAKAATEENHPGDNRFADADWQNWPFSAYQKQFSQAQQFWNQATTGVRGVSQHHENVVNFVARQALDMLSPSNYLFSNPEVLRSTQQQQGQNLWRGLEFFWQDLQQTWQKQWQANPSPEELAYVPGRDVALTPGKVVFKNQLIELIQYAPQTTEVWQEPVLIVPSWIMKYYILDLSPHNSMVNYLVSQGQTVFIISWKNPDSEDRHLGMDDYLEAGLFTALKQVALHTQSQRVHAAGYCLGGSLLAIAAAALPQIQEPGMPELASVSLLAAQTDFTEPGELGLFIDESQLAMLDALMWKDGYLSGEQMAGSFQLLNSRDLIWSRYMRHYLLGETENGNDLMSWNADTTRMPYRMHSEYLKHLFLHNDLAQGRYQVRGKAVCLKALSCPMYVVGTAKDHVSPWRSVYKIHALCDVDIDFVLASGGHNAGIVSEPGHARRSFRYRGTLSAGEGVPAAADWLKQAQEFSGSWWPHWQQWLVRQSSQQVSARQCASELANAPGDYIFIR